jgi:ADP-dependent NAD(P)H-hydrate dehydratase / NAD(P)H-hydrate epimerase
MATSSDPVRVLPPSTLRGDARSHAPWPLFDTAATRLREAALAARLPPHTLMQRAGLQIAKLALAMAPHARVIWIACGPGNNGGDGLEAAVNLQHWGKNVVVTWLGSIDTAPVDTQKSHARAVQAGVIFANEPPENFDLCIDALLGLGAASGATNARPIMGRMADWIARINASNSTVLAVDIPTGLNADTGAVGPISVRATATLSLLTLKPGLFTAHGRDACGDIWLHDLADAGDAPSNSPTPTAWLAAAPAPTARAHASHKGSYGDVAIIGGAPGMTGAALLAARAALHCGAGRVLVGLLDGGSLTVDIQQPELMLRAVDTLDFNTLTLVCGCGGGQAVTQWLQQAIQSIAPVVIDADAINAIASSPELQSALVARAARQAPTVLTPHPLEAARLLGCTAAQVQQDRLSAAQQLSDRLQCTIVLKGSGTIIAAPGQIPVINPTGNARLATAGTGDVLAGMVGARLSTLWNQPNAAAHSTALAFKAACEAVYQHGLAADQWPTGVALTSDGLARMVRG